MADTDDVYDGATMPESARQPVPDAHGQAALLLAESTLHLLIEAGVLTVGQAIDAVRTAAVVKHEVAEEADEPATLLHQSLGLLQRIESSMASAGRT